MPLEIAATSTGPKTAHEYVKDSLRQAILRGTLPGGSRLVQADVARDLKVSTTPVREAMRDLATEGLIRLDPHRGAIVHRLSFDEIQDVHNIVRLLEPEAMRQAVRAITEETLADARALTTEMEGETDPGRWVDLNREFHSVVFRDCRSRHLVEILRKLRDTAAMYTALALSNRPAQIGEANVQHSELMDALDRRDAALAVKLARAHVDITIRTLEVSPDGLER
jgi:DNA-binding GntR family transcriptional regulator